MYRYIVFDVETPNRYNNRISAIGIAVVENGIITEEYFSYVNPETFFDTFNKRLTGLMRIQSPLPRPSMNCGGILNY